MSSLTEIKELLGDAWIPVIYAGKVRTQRTRSINLDCPARENIAEIQYTLLGIELKIGKKRLACPDLATARYLRVFARIGCRKIAVPYDITRISTLADELEVAWQQMLLILAERTKDEPDAKSRRLRSQLIKAIRSELDETGAGESMPEFKQSTKQRKN
jgi:hypothetical protein